MRKIKNIKKPIFENEEVLVSNYAMDKLMTIAEIMEHCEFRTYSISAPGEFENVIQDFHLIEQEVYEDELEIQGINIAVDHLDLLEKGKTIIGKAHGHGRYRLIPSSLDKISIDKLLDIYWENTVRKNVLNFGLNKFRTEKKDDHYVIKAFNNTDAELLVPEVEFTVEELKKIKEHVKLSVLRRIRGEVSDIIVNHTAKDIYCRKRIQEIVSCVGIQDFNYYQNIKKLPESIYSQEGNIIRYCIETAVRQVDTGDNRKVNKDELIEELREKITFRCKLPQSLKKIRKPKKEAISDDEKKIIENISHTLCEYMADDNTYSLWIRKIAFRILKDKKAQKTVAFSTNAKNLYNYKRNLGLLDKYFYADILTQAFTSDIENNHPNTVQFIFTTYKELLNNPNSSQIITEMLEMYFQKNTPEIKKDKSNTKEEEIKGAKGDLERAIQIKNSPIQSDKKTSIDNKIDNKQKKNKTGDTKNDSHKKQLEQAAHVNLHFNEETLYRLYESKSLTASTYPEMKTIYDEIDYLIEKLNEADDSETTLAKKLVDLQITRNKEVIHMFEDGFKNDIKKRVLDVWEEYNLLRKMKPIDSDKSEILYSKLIELKKDQLLVNDSCIKYIDQMKKRLIIKNPKIDENVIEEIKGRGTHGLSN